MEEKSCGCLCACYSPSIFILRPWPAELIALRRHRTRSPTTLIPCRYGAYLLQFAKDLSSIGGWRLASCSKPWDDIRARCKHDTARHVIGLCECCLKARVLCLYVLSLASQTFGSWRRWKGWRVAEHMVNSSSAPKALDLLRSLKVCLLSIINIPPPRHTSLQISFICDAVQASLFPRALHPSAPAFGVASFYNFLPQPQRRELIAVTRPHPSQR